jgi:hypothetical protein
MTDQLLWRQPVRAELLVLVLVHVVRYISVHTQRNTYHVVRYLSVHTQRTSMRLPPKQLIRHCLPPYELHRNLAGCERSTALEVAHYVEYERLSIEQHAITLLSMNAYYVSNNM